MNNVPLIRCIETNYLKHLRQRFQRLYPDQADHCFERLTMLIGRYGIGYTPPEPQPRWSQADTVMITYGDMIHKPMERPLVALKRFMDTHLQGAISNVHILPFSPYSSDDGFSVIDYREVNDKLGKWKDIQAIAESYRVMADLVLNHVSRQSGWFKNYTACVAPHTRYFLESDPNWDLSDVVRPRNLPLLTEVNTRRGPRHLWTTFSEDQIDLNFANPDVLFDFLDILMFYISQGIRVIRLDAIAYLWKKVGTNCIHLPETHEVVKLFRDFIELITPDVIIITETNVPHDENISYFGKGDEAHMVYNFTLPPLLLHALQTGNAKHLTQWAEQLSIPPDGCTYFNFTASHDGIGVRPLEGILSDDDIQTMQQGIIERGGKVSVKNNPDGSTSPYELNITYLDALSDPHHDDDPLHVERFLCSQAIMLAFRGVPGIYFHNLVGTRNDYETAARTQMPRSLNRHKYYEQELKDYLNDDKKLGKHIFPRYLKLLRSRREHRAFHPDAPQVVLKLSESVFAIQRDALNNAETILCLSNVTDQRVIVPVSAELGPLKRRKNWVDLITNKPLNTKPQELSLEPYQTMWLCYKKP